MSRWLVWVLAAAAVLSAPPCLQVAFAGPPPPESEDTTLAGRDAPDPVTRGAIPKNRPTPDRPPQRKPAATGPRKEVGITVRVIPATIRPPSFAFELAQNFPNPSTGSTAFAFSLARPEVVSIMVYDVTGQKVASLVHGQYGVGRYDIRWNARDDQGRLCRPGIYFYRMDAGTYHRTRKLILR